MQGEWAEKAEPHLVGEVVADLGGNGEAEGGKEVKQQQLAEEAWAGDEQNRQVHMDNSNKMVRFALYKQYISIKPKIKKKIQITAPQATPFTPQPGPNISPSCESPEDCFALFFDDALLDYIIDNTNRPSVAFTKTGNLQQGRK